nr:hypothetical protein [Tanacetum cinerariifolium]
MGRRFPYTDLLKMQWSTKTRLVVALKGRLKIIRIGVHYGCGSKKMISAFCEARGNCITSLAMLLQREVPVGSMSSTDSMFGPGNPGIPNNLKLAPHPNP